MKTDTQENLVRAAGAGETHHHHHHHHTSLIERQRQTDRL